MDHSNKNSSGSESNASVICKGYSFSNLAEPVQIHRETYTRTATIQTPVTGDTNGMTRQSVRKPHMNDHHLHRRCFKIDRVGGGITPAVLSHHRTCGSAYGGSYFGCHSRYEPISVTYPVLRRLSLLIAIFKIGLSATRQYPRRLLPHI